WSLFFKKWVWVITAYPTGAGAKGGRGGLGSAATENLHNDRVHAIARKRGELVQMRRITACESAVKYNWQGDSAARCA
uniref:hypothetical protein n=1 Tax=Thiolapillus sp. TaxID=2017437 RepID=UPI003AF41F10